MTSRLFFTVSLVSAIVLPSIAAAQTAQTSFSDVSAGNPNSASIYELRNENVIQGYEDGTFRPDNAINRAEFAKIVIAAKFSAAEIQKCPQVADFAYPGVFSDVPGDAWYVPTLCLASARGIISGYPDGTFRAQNNINFAEASKIIVETYGIPLSDNEPGQQWFQMYITAMKGVGALPQSYRSASRNVTRGEMAFMIQMAQHMTLSMEGDAASSKGAFVGQGCKVGGCSKQVCQDSSAESAVTTCEWNAQYACYDSARCEQQSDGHCGWTQTADLQLCLKGTY